MKFKIAHIFKWKLSILGICLVLVSLCLLYLHQEQAVSIQKIQKQFSQLESNADVEINSLYKQFKKGQNLKTKPYYFYHLYEADRLFGWGNNIMPVGRYKSDLFPGNGLIKLKNGWYYTQTKEAGDISYCLSFCIQNQYELQNDYLKATNPAFWKEAFQVEMVGKDQNAIYNKEGKVVFYAKPLVSNKATSAQLILIPLLLIIGLFFLLFEAYQNWKNQIWASAIVLLCVLVLRIFFYEITWPSVLLETDWFNASFFAYDVWTPSFFDFIINGLFIGFSAQILLGLLKKSASALGKIVGAIAPFLFWLFLVQQLNLILEHSSIPVSFEHLFDLRLSSFVFFSLIGFLIYQFQLFQIYALHFLNSDPFENRKALQYFILFAPFLIHYFIYPDWFNLLPLLTLSLTLFYGKNTQLPWLKLSRQLIILSLFSLILSFHFQTLAKEKEQENRRLYAKQLALERNINLELSYSQQAPEIIKQKWLHTNFDTLRAQMTKVSFEHILSQKFFQGVWDGFEIEADLHDANGKPCFGKDTLHLQKLKTLVSEHGVPSEIEPNVFFMPHEEQGLSYVILIQLPKDHKTLALSLISKRIPEEMGFPRLLISDKAGISKNLDKYSIGKYAEGRLIHQNGDFNFPNTLESFPKKALSQASFEFKNYEHTVFQSSKGSAIFISAPQNTWLNLVTSFAFIFVYWGSMLIGVHFLMGQGFTIGRESNLSFKIQIAFLVILVLSLFLYGLGSSLFIGEQFDNYSQQALKEKLHAVEMELHTELGQLDSLDATIVGLNLEAKTAQLSSVFNTDLFIYDSHGFLITSSRPKLFAFGLVGEHMDADAMDALIGRKNSYYSHQERIGSLKYRSAYIPIMNEKRDLIGFINLQLFGQQQAYENQLEDFLKSAINVFILLLALSVFIALIVSNWLIGPLQHVAKSVKNIEFGKKNQKISYQNKDEIGAIVQSYNEKLIELENAAQKLAKSERENAWRDLAQQIAHEIKNPLTPMRLSIQHLMRKLENQHPDSLTDAQKTLPTLIEQIDGLANMANEFAKFAKLPEPTFEKLALNSFLKQTLLLFKESSLIHFESLSEEVFIFADKSMMVQVMNNLLTNAIHATQETPYPQVDLTLAINHDRVIISIKDNGIGMNDASKEKVFTPYFTTKSSGSGIGLNVVRQIIEKHNGKVYFETEEGTGSCFFVELPLFSEGL
ncbi:MAG: hypothetical protein RLZZ65_1953 [Bacteroidota bacterium]|jgi:signal transduction histidine kinase